MCKQIDVDRNLVAIVIINNSALDYLMKVIIQFQVMQKLYTIQLSKVRLILTLI